MRLRSIVFPVLWALSSGAWADDLNSAQILYGERSVETQTLSIQLTPSGPDVRFAVTLRDKESGAEQRHEFDGEGANDPAPFQLAVMSYCDTSVVLLTVEYPWRHDLPQYARVLETFAFRRSDFEFIDEAFGPMTDVALLDSSHPEAADTKMQPPILVECLSESANGPFRFVMNTRN